MKTILTKYLAWTAALLLCFGCQEELVLTVMEDVNFTSVPEISVASIVLTEELDYETVLNVTWDEVKFPVEAPVSYTLQFALPSDTTGSIGWSNAYQKQVGNDVYTASVTGAELNAIADGLDIEPGVEGNMVVRVQASLNRAVYSKALALKVTPSVVEVVTDMSTLFIAGDFQGWNIEEAVKIVSANDDGIYEGYINIPEGGTNEFKLYSERSWDSNSYGTEEEGVLMLANFAGANLSVPSAGYYLVLIDLNAMTYLLKNVTWGLIGAASPGGWDSDTPMDYDESAQVWRATAEMRAEGSFKIRANSAWELDFGLGEGGRPRYENHPWLPYEEGAQFTVPENGNYTITLDLHEAGNYSVRIRRN